MSGATFPLTLNAGHAATLGLQFKPTAAGAATGQLVITSNSKTGSTIVNVSGTGIAPPPGQPAQLPGLTVDSSSIAFGSVALNAPSTQSVILQSTGTGPLIVFGNSVSGTGFNVSGGIFPLTMTPSQSATLSVQFDPTAAGAATGQLTIASNATANPTVQINLSGTGEAARTVSYQVALSWDAPTSSGDAIAGYNVYSAPSGSSSYQKLNSATNSQVAYTDPNVQSGSTYQYYVTSVDSAGTESVPSNIATVAVP